MLFHPPSGKRLIGISVDMNNCELMQRTMLEAKRHPNQALQAAYNHAPSMHITRYITTSLDAAYGLELVLINHYLPQGLLFNTLTEAKKSVARRGHNPVDDGRRALIYQIYDQFELNKE